MCRAKSALTGQLCSKPGMGPIRLWMDEGLQLAGDGESGVFLGAFEGLDLLLDGGEALLDWVGLGSGRHKVAD
jgi:hypothetical protein